MESKQDIWVWIEGGTGKHTGLELITPGRELAEQLKGTLTAVVIGCPVEEAIAEAASCGVDKIVAIDDQAYPQCALLLYPCSTSTVWRYLTD